MATATVTPAAPSAPAAASPAPVSAPVAAPTPAAAPAAAPAQPTFTGGGVTTHVDPRNTSSEKFAADVLKEKLAAIPAEVPEIPDAPLNDENVGTEIKEPEAPEAPVVETPAPDAEAKPVEEEAVPEFDFDPPAVITPDALTKMITDNPDFGQLLEADPRLKGQMYKTAREAAELQPYKEIFPDLDSAKSAISAARDFDGVRDIFRLSTTKEGTQKTLAKIAELSYERDDNGDVVMRDGKPVVGEDYHAFVKHTTAMELDKRLEPIKARLAANQYHLDPKVQALAETDLDQAQAMVNAAYAKDRSLVDGLGEIMGDQPQAQQELPAHLQERERAIAEREKKLQEKEHGGKVQNRQQFDNSVRDEAGKRMTKMIDAAMSHATKNGAVIQPFIVDAIRGKVTAALITKLNSIDAVGREMEQLQKLPATEASKTRRLAAVDRHYQMYAPEIIRNVFKDAGIQLSATAQARAEKREGQIAQTKQTEIQGSRGKVAPPAPLSAKDAYSTAEAEWRKGNPGRVFDNLAQESILSRVVNLQLQGR